MNLRPFAVQNPEREDVHYSAQSNRLAYELSLHPTNDEYHRDRALCLPLEKRRIAIFGAYGWLVVTDQIQHHARPQNHSPPDVMLQR